ncbi:MAG: DMT family transporter [Rhodobacteraceae bacterium]|nr:DMT family transporter [Paracoccaceae bacterium]
MDVRAIFMGLAFAVMWSSAFTSARIIVAAAPPLMALSLRFLISGLIALAIARLMGERLRLTREQWIATALFGLCQNALYLGLNFVAMQTVEASLAAIIASSLPLWVALIGWIAFSERMSGLGVLGLIGGFVGVALIMGSRLSGGVDPFGVALCVVGVLALTLATLVLRGASSGGNILTVVGFQMLFGSAFLAVPAVLLETPVIEPSWTLAAAFLYTLLIPGLAATWVWFLLVRRIGAVRAATFHFLNPFLGVAIAALVLGEAMGTLDYVGVAIIMAGILAVQLSRQKQS